MSIFKPHPDIQRNELSVRMWFFYAPKPFAAVVIAILGLIIYSNSFCNSFHFDDNLSIVGNPSIKHITDLKAIWNFWPTRFITYLSFAVNYYLNRLDLFGYHLFNLIAHLGAAILVWWLAGITFHTPVMKGKKISRHADILAFFAALIFLTHPIQTQAVVYIVQRAALLATLFYLASLSFYVKARLSRYEGRSLSSCRIYYAASLITAAIAVFTKEIAVTLPLMILVYEACFLRGNKNIDLKKIAPFIIIALIVPIVMIFTKSFDFTHMRRVPENITIISSRQYLLTQFRVIVTYIRLLFIPLNQQLDYNYPIAKSLFELPAISSLLFLTVILTVAIRIFSKYRIISFSILWFFITLLPESSFIPIKDVIFEHRCYLPMVGYSIFLVCGLYYIFEKKNISFVVTILLVIISIYSILAYNRNLVWRNELSLWNEAVRKAPDKARPYLNRGSANSETGDLDKAISDYSKAIELDPGYEEAYDGLGTAYYKKGDLDRALSNYNKAISANAYYAPAYHNRGLIYDLKGDFEHAVSDYNKAIQINPLYEDAYNNRGGAYAAKGYTDKAISDFSKAIYLNPGSISSYYNRALAYFDEKEYEKCREDIRKIENLSVRPDPAVNARLKALLRALKGLTPL